MLDTIYQKLDADAIKPHWVLGQNKGPNIKSKVS